LNNRLQPSRKPAKPLRGPPKWSKTPQNHPKPIENPKKPLFSGDCRRAAARGVLSQDQHCRLRVGRARPDSGRGWGKGGAEAFRIGYVAGLAHWLASLYWLLLIPYSWHSIPIGPAAGWLALSAFLALYRRRGCY